MNRELLRTRPSAFFGAITVLALAVALLFSPVTAQDDSAPDKPRGLEATASHGEVVLTWDDPDDDSITGYVILRRVRVNDTGGDFSVLVSDTATAATTYTDNTVAASLTYTYRIKAINGAGTSERSRWYHIDTPAAPVPTVEPTVAPTPEQAVEPPAKPEGLEATASHGEVVLTWDDPGDDSVTGYVILRRVRVNDVGGDFSVLVADTGTAATTYTDDTVAASTTYTYRIKAINEHGVSERSRWFHIDTPNAPEATLVEADDADEQAAPQRRSEYVDAHNAGVDDVEALPGYTDPLNPDAGEPDDDEDDNRKSSKQGKSVGTQQGRNIGMRATANICDRTPEVVDALLDAIEDNGHASVTCSTVTDAQLNEVFEIFVRGYSNDKIVPSDFAGLPDLTELLISGSEQLTTIQANAFSELSASSSFGSLLLGANRIKTVDRDAFDGLSLSDSYWPTPRIVLSGNVIETLPLGVFDEVSGLEGLELQYNHISGFEEGFFANLPDLEELSLTGNDIKIIPTGMFKGLAALTYLALSHNALTAVEEDYFADLSKLEDLGLAYNDISSLHPTSFSGLTSLQKLDLQRNVILELPADIFDDQSSLTELRLTTNDIVSLDPGTFEGTPNLEMLYLNGNYFVNLPEDIFEGLDGLRQLSLDYNKLAGLPADIFDPLDETLTRLDLNNNEFGTLPGMSSTASTA